MNDEEWYEATKISQVSILRKIVYIENSSCPRLSTYTSF